MSPEEQRRANARRQIEEDAEYERQQAAKRPVQTAATPMPAARTPAAQSEPAPSASAPTVSPSIGSAASALRGRGIEAMGKKYGFFEGTPFVEGPPGRDKVDAKLTRGEAVLPAETVAALGGPEVIAQLIQQTTGHRPQRGTRKGKKKVKAFFGYTDEQLDQQRRAGVAYGNASQEAAKNRLDFTTPHFTQVNDAFKAPPRPPVSVAPATAPVAQPRRGNFSDGTMDANPTVATAPSPKPAAPASGPSYFQQYYPATRDVYQGSGPAIAQAYQQGGLPAAAGMTARKAVEYLPAVGSDIMRNVDGAIDPAANALKTAVTGDPTPINKPEVAVSAANGENYGNEHQRPTYAERGAGTPGASPAAAAMTAQTAYDTPNTAYFGGKGRTYTQDELSAMAGPDNSASVRSPMEIYANEAMLNAAMPSVPKGGSIAWDQMTDGRPGGAPPTWDKAAWAALAAKSALNEPGKQRQQQQAIANQAEQAGARNQFFTSAQGSEMRGVQTSAAKSAAAQQKGMDKMYQDILSTKDPAKRAQKIQEFLAMYRQKGTLAPIAVPGGEAVGPDGLTVAKQPSAVYDPNAGQFFYQQPQGQAQAPASPYAEGQTLRGKDGKLYVVKDGQPVLRT